MTTIQTTQWQTTRLQPSAVYAHHSRQCSRLPSSPAIAPQTLTFDEKRPQNTGIAHALAGEGSFSGQQNIPRRTASRFKQRQEDSSRDIQATTAHGVVTRFFQHLNRRELGNLFSLLAPEVVYTNNTLQAQHIGKPAVVKFYIDTLSSVPQGSQLVLEEVVVAAAPEPPSHALQEHATVTGAATRRVSVAWHLELGGVLVPGSEGVGLYRVDTQRGFLTELKDTPQAALQVLLPAMALATPVIDVMSPVLLPALGQVSTHHHAHGSSPAGSGRMNNSEQGFGSLLQPMSVIQGAAELAAGAAGSLASLLTGRPAAGPSQSMMAPWAADWYGTTAASTNTESNGFGFPGFGTSQPSMQQERPAGHSRNDTQSDRVRMSQQPTSQRQSPAYNIPMRPLSPERDVMPSDMTSGRPVTNRSHQAEASQQSMYSNNGGMPQQPADATLVQPATFSDIPDTPVDLSGVWEKDAVKSDAASYEQMMDVLGLSGLQRVTARLIEGVEIKQTEDSFAVSFLTVVPFFKVTENTKFGSEVRLMRRDLKPGQQTATTQQIPGGVRISFKWGPPNAGTLTEEYVLVGNGPSSEMHVRSSIAVGDKSANVVQVYQRSGKDRDQLLKESRARNNSLESVLERQKKQFGQ